MEHARSRSGIADAAHAEYGAGGTPVISLLSCSINGADIAVRLQPGSLLAGLHGDVDEVIEHATCNYGLDADFASIASTHGLRPSGIDELGEIRAVERTDHPFFVATLYQPQLRSTLDTPHPVFVGFVTAAAARARG